MTDTMTTQEAAEFLGVHPVTLRKWRMKSEQHSDLNDYEDCQGLQWWYEHERRIVYNSKCVKKLKRILQRRKGK